jgi:hypothetical protein
MDPTTVAVVSEALAASGGQVKTLDELVTRVREVTVGVAAGPGDRRRLEKARAFCVALSRVADAYSAAIDHGDTRHPYGNVTV